MVHGSFFLHHWTGENGVVTLYYHNMYHPCDSTDGAMRGNLIVKVLC